MNDDKFYCWFTIFFFLIGMLLGSCFCNSKWKQESVDKGFSEYNQKTGEWQWKPKIEEVKP